MITLDQLAHAVHVRENRDAEAAEVVRKIFTWYADGTSPRGIADRLNAAGIPSPGAQWRRKTRRTDAKWLASAIHGDPKRGSGILNNSLYIGQLVWNRRQMKKRPRTSRRVAIMRTAADQIVREEPTLRIIDDALWERVKTRQAKQSHELGQRVIGGLRKHRPGGGRPSKYLLSGLLKCDACHAGFVLSNGARYQCASHTNGGSSACSVSLSLLKDRAEQIILDFTERELPGILASVEARYRQPDGPVDHSAEIRELEKQQARLASAIKLGGELKVLVGELKATGAKIARLQAQSVLPATPAHIIAREPLERRLARTLAQLKQGGETAQGVLREVFPAGFWLYPDPDGRRYLWAVTQTAAAADWQNHVEADGHLPAQYRARVYNANGRPEEKVGNSMVAGAGFEPATFGL